MTILLNQALEVAAAIGNGLGIAEGSRLQGIRIEDCIEEGCTELDEE